MISRARSLPNQRSSIVNHQSSIIGLIFASLLILASLSARAAIPEPIAPWKMELLAESPQINHPSVVVSAPDGRIFVAEDPMDISTPRADAKLGRIICFHPDGRRTVFAEGLHAVFGLQYLEGKVYVLHNPHFSAFVDEGDKAGAREELVESTNPNPWALEWNDHVPANFKLAMDGFFYIAVGDKGLYNAKGRDGRVVNLHGGGIARIRPDGTGFEVVCTGVRNILDVALNDEDEMFTYDNTDEHNWMGRLTHMVEGGYYGYPHDFQPRRPYTLWMMADFGPGAACGAICATEGGLPSEYNNDLFLSDFGKRQIMRVKVRRAGATYEVVSKQDLFPNPPEDFRPVGIAWAPNGRDIFICDWQHRDVKANKKVGRLWKLSYGPVPVEKPRPTWYSPLALGKKSDASSNDLASGLEHPSREVRLIAQRELSKRSDSSKQLAAIWNDASKPVSARTHALWAIVSQGLFVRGLTDHAGPQLTRQFARSLGQIPAFSDISESLLNDQDAGVQFWAARALGQHGGWSDELLRATGAGDAIVRHAAINALSRMAGENRIDIRRLAAHLGVENKDIRQGVLFALRGIYNTALIDALFGEVLLRSDTNALQLIADLHHKPAEWKGEWWAYHPALAPPPKKTMEWEGTPRVKEILLKHIDARKELAVIAIRGIGEGNFQEGAEKIRAVLEKKNADPEVRHAAVDAIVELRPAWAAEVLTRFAESNTNAFAGLVKIGGPDAERFVAAQLASNDATKQKRALVAASQLRSKALVEPLVAFAKQPETRADAVNALAQIPDARALDVYLSALDEKNITLRESIMRALRLISKGVKPAIPAKELSTEQASALREVYREDSEMVAYLNSKYPAASEPSIDQYILEGRGGKGNTTIGQRIFENEQGVACIKCHRVAGKGGSIGPDLTTAGAQFGRDDLIESILFPSKVIREGNQQMEIETTDDESYVGLSKGETGSEYRLLNANGQLQTIPKSKVKSTRLSNTSMMPEGLHRAMSPSDFADLIAYLETLR